MKKAIIMTLVLVLTISAGKVIDKHNEEINKNERIFTYEIDAVKVTDTADEKNQISVMKEYVENKRKDDMINWFKETLTK